MILTADKLVAQIREINDHTPMKLVRRAMLAKYEELRNTYPAAQFTRDGFKEGSDADRAFAKWYAEVRGNKIRGERVSAERMQIHARWHLRNIFLSQRSNVVTKVSLQRRRSKTKRRKAA